MRCLKCGRKLTRPPVQGMGPVCAAAALGVKPQHKTPRAVQAKRDEQTPDLFEGVV